MSEDRLLSSFDRLAASSPAREGKPDATSLGLWSYAVVTANETTFSGRALSSRNPHPDLPKIPNMPGLPGTLLQPEVGSTVGVMFLDGDPAQPRCVAWDQVVPVSVGLAGGGTALHRVGDLGRAGTLTTGIAPVTLVYTDPQGLAYSITLAAGATPVTAVIAGPGGVEIPLITQAVQGSPIVTSG